MYYLLFREHRWGNKGLDVPYITKIAPSAKVFQSSDAESSIVQHYFKLLDESYSYSAIEVEDEAQADTLQRLQEHLAIDKRGWYSAKLVYVFKDIVRDNIDKDAVLLKLGAQSKFEETDEEAHKADSLSTFSRRLKKFMIEVHDAEEALGDLYDGFVKLNAQFEQDLEAFRKDRKKAKADATKIRTAMRNKLMRYAVYKDGR